MKKFRLFLFLVFAAVFSCGFVAGDSRKAIARKLYGKIRVVDIGEDYKVCRVGIGEDLKVRVVSLGADKVGLWEFVDIGEDWKVCFVEIGEDIKVCFVEIGEGVCR